jgi:hypothetical protein
MSEVLIKYEQRYEQARGTEGILPPLRSVPADQRRPELAPYSIRDTELLELESGGGIDANIRSPVRY